METVVVLLALAPAILGVAVLSTARRCGAATRRCSHHDDAPWQPAGPPIERLAADLRRLLRLHGELLASAQLAMRAHRIWAVEEAIGVRAIEAARALDVPHAEAGCGMTRSELIALLHALTAAGLVLPSTVGPFTGPGRP